MQLLHREGEEVFKGGGRGIVNKYNAKSNMVE